MPQSSEDKWQCHTCGTGYAEYVNGCPVCWERGIRSKVACASELEDIAAKHEQQQKQAGQQWDCPCSYCLEATQVIKGIGVITELLDVADYLYGGDRDVIIKYQTVKIVRVRFKQVCCSAFHGRTVASIPPGTLAMRESAWISDYGRFMSSYTCLNCIERAKKELEGVRGQ